MEMYWWLLLPKLGMFFRVIGVITGLISILLGMMFIDTDDKEICKTFLWFFFFSILFILISCFFPDKSDLAIMFGWDAIKSDNVQEVIELLKVKLR